MTNIIHYKIQQSTLHQTKAKKMKSFSVELSAAGMCQPECPVNTDTNIKFT